MNISPSILIYGTAPDLIETRKWVLTHAGFDVKLALKIERVTELLRSCSFDLFILCHSLSLMDCEAALSQVHSVRPGMKNLILNTVLSSCKGTERDAHLTAFASPQALIAEVRKLTTHISLSAQRDPEMQILRNCEVE